MARATLIVVFLRLDAWFSRRRYISPMYAIAILRVPDDDVIASLDRIRDGDPYYQRGLAQYELISWAPTIGKDALDKM